VGRSGLSVALYVALILGGLTPAPHEQWVKQIARNVTGVTGELTNVRYLVHDRDGKWRTRLARWDVSVPREVHRLAILAAGLSSSGRWAGWT